MDIEQPVVMVRATEIVTMPLQRVMEVLVVKGVVVSKTVAIDNGTEPADATNGNSTVSMGTTAFGPMHTAAAAVSRFMRTSDLGG